MNKVAVTAALAVVLLAGCAPAAPAPPPPPAKTAAPVVESKAAKPADEAAGLWERTLQAARGEGTVAVAGPAGTAERDALTEGFQRKYSITVEFESASGPDFAAKISAERTAGRYAWDVFIGGTTTALTVLIPMGALDPLEPQLLLPEVKDLKNWRGGALEFVDSGRSFLVMTASQRGTLFVNPNLVKADEFKSYRDLLDPKWAGKLAMHDPRIAGPGQGTFTLFYLHPELGPNFIRALAQQQPVTIRDRQQQLDALAKGQYLALVGGFDTIEPLIRQGLPISIVDPRQLREGSDLSPGVGSAGLVNRAPHPNAAKVYLNWLLSQEGQTDLTGGTGYISARLDVRTDHTFPWRVPLPGSIKTYTKEAIDAKEPLLALIGEVVGQ